MLRMLLQMLEPDKDKAPAPDARTDLSRGDGRTAISLAVKQTIRKQSGRRRIAHVQLMFIFENCEGYRYVELVDSVSNIELFKCIYASFS